MIRPGSATLCQIKGFSVVIERKRMKSIRLTIVPQSGSIHISAPYFCPFSKIEAFIIQKEDWINQKLEELKIRPKEEESQLLSGDNLMLFGTQHELLVVTAPKFFADHNEQVVFLKAPKESSIEERNKYLNKYLRKVLEGYLSEKVDFWAKTTGLIPSSWHIKKMKSRWGTCNTRDKRIWLNFQLIKTPVECIDYVILHELAHIKVPNHGADFKAILTKYMPDWKSRKKLLNQFILLP